MKLSKEEWKAAERLIGEALKEDRAREDLTSRLLIPPASRGHAVILAKEKGILSGLEIARKVFKKLNSKIQVQLRSKDGASLQKNQIVLAVKGPLRSILSAERTALNFLGRLSGIATLTRQFVERAKSNGVQILDTRKTTPGLRHLEKYAVRCGGGQNHRSSLAEAVFIKDNHWKYLNQLIVTQGDSRLIMVCLAEIFKQLRKRGKELIVEVENERQLQTALELKPSVLLFDNQSPRVLKKLCRKVRKLKLRPAPQLEVSGGIALENVKAYAASGVDRISVGALTHSARSLNFSLEIQ